MTANVRSEGFLEENWKLSVDLQLAAESAVTFQLEGKTSGMTSWSPEPWPMQLLQQYIRPLASRLHVMLKNKTQQQQQKIFSFLGHCQLSFCYLK